MQKRLLCVLPLLMLALASQAQDKSEYELFSEAAGSKSVLYRGQSATKYMLRYNGHYFWDTREYKPGTVMYNGKLYKDVLLNVDACEQELLTRVSMGSSEIKLQREYVEWFQIGEDRYVNLKLQNVAENVADGFYIEHITPSGPVYFRVEKLLNSSVNNNNGYSGIGYDDEYYMSDVYDCFIIQRRYYIIKKGKLKKVGRYKAEKLINE